VQKKSGTKWKKVAAGGKGTKESRKQFNGNDLKWTRGKSRLNIIKLWMKKKKIRAG